jgi:hypothetical protein
MFADAIGACPGSHPASRLRAVFGAAGFSSSTLSRCFFQTLKGNPPFGGGIPCFFFKEIYMLNREVIKGELSTMLSPFVPRNCKQFHCNFYDGQPRKSIFGFNVDPYPFSGKIVAKTDDAIIVKDAGARADFSVLDRALVTQDPAEGAQVRVEPYARRRFDGERADAPVEEIRTLPDGSQYRSMVTVLGQATAKLPIPEPRCSELRQLIEQLESLPAPDGFRNITHMMVDAGATDFSWVDPEPQDIIRTPPAISFSVSTTKFQGRVTVLYEAGFDLYAVELSRDGELVERVDYVGFDDLGQVLERLIDDGAWRGIRVTILNTRH